MKKHHINFNPFTTEDGYLHNMSEDAIVEFVDKRYKNARNKGDTDLTYFLTRNALFALSVAENEIVELNKKLAKYETIIEKNMGYDPRMCLQPEDLLKEDNKSPPHVYPDSVF